MAYLTDEDVLLRQRALVQRRRLFKQAFSAEVLDALAEFLGVKDAVLAFSDDYNPYRACQLDAQMGVLRGIMLEIRLLEESEQSLELMEKMINVKEVEHA